MPTISQLPTAVALTGTEPLPVVQSGTTVQSTPAALSAYLPSALGARLLLLQPNGSFYTFATLPSAAANNGVPAYTTDQGLVYSNGTAWVAVLGNYLSPQMFGAKGDGVTDDTNALTSWYQAAGNNTLFLVPGSVYLFNPAQNATEGLNFLGVSHFNIQGNGATIRRKASTSASGNVMMMFFANCTDFAVDNLIIDGNNANCTNLGVFGGQNIHVSYQCARGQFTNVRSINACLDGFYLDAGSHQGVAGDYPTDISLINCFATNSYRNGTSLIGSKRFTMIGGQMGTSTGNNAGGGPCAGIDIEPDSGTTFANTDTLITNVNLIGNDGSGIQISGAGSSRSKRVRIINCNFEANARAVHLVANADNVLLDGIFMSQQVPIVAGHFITTYPYTIVSAGTTNFVAIGAANNNVGTTFTPTGVGSGTGTASPRAFIDISADSAITDLTIRNVHIDNCTISSSNNAIYLDHSPTARISVDGVHIDTLAGGIITSGGPVTVNNLVARNLTAAGGVTLYMTMNGAGTILRNVTLDTLDSSAIPIYSAAANVEMDNVSIYDAASTNSAILIDSGSTGTVLRNCSVIQRTSIPAGQIAYKFFAVPRVVENCQAISAGTDYTTATAWQLPAWTSTTTTNALTRIGNGTPPPPVPSLASAVTIYLPRVGNTVSITGTTNITSVDATNWTGQQVTLVFTGILTLSNGSNLKLTANFTTAAGSAITLASDGTNWYEVGRKA